MKGELTYKDVIIIPRYLIEEIMQNIQDKKYALAYNSLLIIAKNFKSVEQTINSDGAFKYCPSCKETTAHNKLWEDAINPELGKHWVCQICSQENYEAKERE